jgi:hypothetical protein
MNLSIPDFMRAPKQGAEGANVLGSVLPKERDMTRRIRAEFWEHRSTFPKTSKKSQKSFKRLLTFLWDDDKIHKLTRAADRRIGAEP